MHTMPRCGLLLHVDMQAHKSRDSYISRLLSLSLCMVTEALSDSFEFLGAIEISLSIYLSIYNA